jgi:hypothetical protein
MAHEKYASCSTNEMNVDMNELRLMVRCYYSLSLFFRSILLCNILIISIPFLFSM